MYINEMVQVQVIYSYCHVKYDFKVEKEWVRNSFRFVTQVTEEYRPPAPYRAIVTVNRTYEYHRFIYDLCLIKAYFMQYF